MTPSAPPSRPLLRPGQMDQLAEALLVLTREVWVLTDRLTIVEAVLEARGGLTQDEIETYRPDAAVEARLTTRRQSLISAVEAALKS
ncbi:hypothetical protein [Caulobacter sp.]|uniref:hypothetical protein n=1 Tax=Caulobacter sp. TaxID=78 RepID=UPI003BAB777D